MADPSSSLPQAPSIMGILNVTPDSFSDGGQFFSLNAAVARAKQLVQEGAHIIDIGGESTRPGAQPVDVDEEIRRVVPVIEACRELFVDQPVRLSIDTRNAETAYQAIHAGADLINDVSASLSHVAAATGVGWVAMHMLGDPRTMQVEPHYDDVVSEVTEFLANTIENARNQGVTEIWADPGIGFGKTTEHNLELLAGFDALNALGVPLLIGTSRKRFLGALIAQTDQRATTPGGPRVEESPALTGPDPVPLDDRLDGSLLTAAWAVRFGASVVRVHDVGATRAMFRSLHRPD